MIIYVKIKHTFFIHFPFPKRPGSQCRAVLFLETLIIMVYIVFLVYIVFPQKVTLYHEVILMCKDLIDLLSKSSSTRGYFVSLPVWLQLGLHEHHNNIKTAAQLHITADILMKQRILTESLRQNFK